MSTALSPPSPTWTPGSPGRKGGILLNSCSSSSSSVHSPLRTSFSLSPSRSRSTRSLDSSSDEALSPSTTLGPSPSLNTNTASGSRSPSIKFAALPDPRADEDDFRRLSIDGSRSPTAKELSLEVEPPLSSSSGWRGGHRRGSKSMDGSSKKRSKSPIGINMLNGRVYGSRVMESAKQVEKEAQKGEVFKEWGDSGLGSNSRAEEEDEDDGSGMAWIRKRRESKQREEQAAQEAEALKMKDLKTGLDSLLLAPESPSSGSQHITTSQAPTTPPPAPRIQLQPPSRQSTMDFQESRKTAASAGVEIYHRHKEE